MDSNTTPDPFKEFLSEEDYNKLQEIQNKFVEKFREYQSVSGNIPEEVLNFDQKDPYAFDLVNKPNHISDQDRELIFYIRAELSTIDYQNQKYISLDECYNQSYHIPIPSGIDFNQALNNFVQEFETNMSKIGKKINLSDEQ